METSWRKNVVLHVFVFTLVNTESIYLPGEESKDAHRFGSVIRSVSRKIGEWSKTFNVDFALSNHFRDRRSANIMRMISNSLSPRHNGRLFADDTFKRIFLNENIRISTKNSLKFVPKGLINNIPALVLIMAPTRRQAIIWTNDGQITDAYMRHSASMS